MLTNGVINPDSLGGDTELIIPVMVKDLLPTPLVIIFMGACLSAVMGAASSLLAMASMISKNVWKDFLKPDTSDKQLVLVSRICVVSFALIALYLALKLKSLFTSSWLSALT